jgi:hypothetical protein
VWPLSIQAISSSTFGLAGWPLAEFGETKPSSWLGNDPVLGRLICPSLTRLNLQKASSEPLVLKSVQTEHSAEGASVWILTLRSGIYWWGGNEVSVVDLAEFFKKNLASIVLEKGSGAWHLPQFEIKIIKESVHIFWKKGPEFGPYILNAIPLWKERKGEKIPFECVGRYIPSRGDDQSFFLRANLQYPNTAPSLYFESIKDFRDKKHKGLVFSMVADFDGEVGKIDIREQKSCECLMDTPLFSAVIWYDTPKLTQTLRKHMSTLFPRDAFLKIGAGHWGALTPSLVPRHHPGFNHSISIPKFSLTPSQERVSLFLSSAQGKIGLLEKVWSDNLIVGGVDVQFVPQEDPRVDGLITGLFVPWPELDLYDSFHSKGKSILGRRREFSKGLDKVLEQYRESLTREIPNFESLRRIQALLYHEEWVSVLLQHKICLKWIGLEKKKVIMNIKDPDWFMNILTQLGGVS